MIDKNITTKRRKKTEECRGQQCRNDQKMEDRNKEEKPQREPPPHAPKRARTKWTCFIHTLKNIFHPCRPHSGCPADRKLFGVRVSEQQWLSAVTESGNTFFHPILFTSVSLSILWQAQFHSCTHLLRYTFFFYQDQGKLEKTYLWADLKCRIRLYGVQCTAGSLGSKCCLVTYDCTGCDR